MSQEADERLARALFEAFDKHVHVPQALEVRLLQRVRTFVREAADDLDLRTTQVDGWHPAKHFGTSSRDLDGYSRCTYLSCTHPAHTAKW